MKKSKKTERINIRCTSETKQILQQIANIHDCKISDVINNAIEEFIKRNFSL